MKRIFILCFVVVLLVILSCSASAAIIDWQVYIDDVSEEQVYCWIPQSNFTVQALNKPGGSVIAYSEGSGTLSHSFSAGMQPCFQVRPFGAANRLTLDRIPSGTDISYSIKINYSGTALYGNIITYCQYFDQDMNIIQSDIMEQGAATLPQNITIDYTMNIPSGAKFFTMWTYCQGWTVLSSPAVYGVSCSGLSIFLYIEGFETYFPGYRPPVAGEFDQIIQDEDELLNVWGDYFDSFENWVVNVADYIDQFSDSFFVMAWVIDGLMSNFMFSGLLYFALVFGALGSILGITSIALRSSDRAERIRERQSRSDHRSGGGL